MSANAARLIPFNAAEAILEPFWDPALSGLAAWTVEPGDAWGLQVGQGWCWAEFEWARRPPAGEPALRLQRAFGLECAGYDTLLVSAMLPPGAVLRVRAETDTGLHEYVSAPAGNLKKEHALPLGGARRLERVTLEVRLDRDGVHGGWFNWVGLQNAAALPRHLAQYAHWDAHWEGYLKPAGFEPSFVPHYGLLVGEAELDALRARCAGNEAAPLLARGRAALARPAPETLVSDFVNFWGDTRYCRERDHGRSLLSPGPYGYGVYAALAGLLLRDAALLRLAARHAMALAMCTHWDDGMICDLPGSPFEHRCFVQSLCVQEAALILDLAGEWFTDLGRELLLRRIAEEGLGSIHFNTWRYEYIFHCNQLAWFTPGRMLGCLLLERHWPRVKPYTELALKDLVESLGYAILPDGGYVEGPTYFRCVGRDGGLPLYLYARSRGLAFDAVVPESMRRTAEFGAAVRSSDAAQDVIPICDAGNRTDSETLSVMAALLPQSDWTAMYRKAAQRWPAAGDVGPQVMGPAVLRRDAAGDGGLQVMGPAVLRRDAAGDGGLQVMGPAVLRRSSVGAPDSVLAAVLDARIPAAAPEPAPFVFLPEMGIMASHRRLGGHEVKLLLMGNQAGAGHTHEDKGSFVLEFAGETFAMDPGTCDYSHPLAGELHNAERHNMLVPFGTAARPAPQCPLRHDVKPQGHGDATAFHAVLDATPGWEPFYRQWAREWDSPAPDTLVIRDRWSLAQGDGVECYWQTQRDVRVEGRTVTLTGRAGTVVIEAPADCTIRVDELPLLTGVQRRIAFVHPRREGGAELRVRLKPIE